MRHSIAGAVATIAAALVIISSPHAQLRVAPVGERVLADREFTRLVGVRALRVAEIVQPIDHLLLGDPLAAIERERPREDARIRPLELALHARVDQLRERDVVVAENRRAEDERDADADKRPELPATAAGKREPGAGTSFCGGLRGDRGHVW